jgi:hypothetical protein
MIRISGIKLLQSYLLSVDRNEILLPLDLGGIVTFQVQQNMADVARC